LATERRSTVLCIGLLALALLAPMAARPAPAAEAPVPISAFFDHPSMSGAALSPDGKRVAFVFNNPSTKGYDQLGVIDLTTQAITVVAAVWEADVDHFEWISNERLVYDSRDRIAPGKHEHSAGLYAVNADGSARRQVIFAAGDWRPSLKMKKTTVLGANAHMLWGQGAQDSNIIYYMWPEYGKDGFAENLELWTYDTMTGEIERVRGPSGNKQSWFLDGKGRPALASTLTDNRETLHYRDPASGAWRALLTQDAFLGTEGGFTPLGFTPQEQLIVLGYGKRDTAAPFLYDLATGKMAERPLVDMPAYDFNGGLITGNGKLLGIRYLADGAGTVWFDAGMQAVQQAVDKLLPGRINLPNVGVRSETPYVLVASWSDRQPLQFLVYDRATGKLSKLGETHPAIDPARMAPLDLVQVKARDGEPIPTWVTIPAGAQDHKRPMVVLVHGGPYVRGSEWSWDPERQFLAARGYVVIEPEYRGSTGYGDRHFRAGWKQWGLKMQDDIADATRWAISQGIADPQRICIAGASYGGYATLMGLIRDPDLYKCGVDWVGVTDIGLLYDGGWFNDDAEQSDAYKRYGMPTMVGDPVKDAAQFAATSPLKQAARITQPLLLAYGGADQRVPIYHGRKFYDAVKKNNKQVEWVVYDDEGHGWKLRETQLDFWGRVIQFLDGQIGTASH
jgi:dipeptidyl aminopeptidase/acylaminoacyl peptidase